jgi:hypothetical protein
VLGGFSIGAFLVPIALLAVLTFLVAPKRGGRESTITEMALRTRLERESPVEPS